MPRLGVTRRGFGEGSIYRRSDGRWVSYIRMPDGRKKFFTSAPREVVKRRLDEAKRQADAGRLVVGRDQSVHEYLERWLAGAVLIFANLPFTILVILPTNKRLQALAPAAADGSTRRAIETWARLHLVRDALGLSATAIYLWAGH